MYFPPNSFKIQRLIDIFAGTITISWVIFISYLSFLFWILLTKPDENGMNERNIFQGRPFSIIQNGFLIIC